jgi:hypothetical protein
MVNKKVTQGCGLPRAGCTSNLDSAEPDARKPCSDKSAGREGDNGIDSPLAQPYIGIRPRPQIWPPTVRDLIGVIRERVLDLWHGPQPCRVDGIRSPVSGRTQAVRRILHTTQAQAHQIGSR